MVSRATAKSKPFVVRTISVAMHHSWQPQPPPPKTDGGAGPIIAIIAGILGIMMLFGVAIVGAVFWVRLRAAPTPVVTGPLAPPISSSSYSGPGWSDVDSPVPVTSKDPMRGDRDALVTIVVFSDFQCPFCGKLEKTLDDVRAAYSSSEVRIIWKNSPLAFHAQARPAAEAAEGVFEVGGNAEFWQFHDQVFANQTSLNATNYEKWARATGTNMSTWSSGLAKGDYTIKVSEDEMLAKTLGVTGTPTCFINGTSMVGAQPLTSFKTHIDTELSHARGKLAAGVARDRVYVETSKENFTKPSTHYTPPVTGVVTTDLKVGTGAMAIRGDTLVVHYTGKLDDGSVFDSSIGSKPFEFELGRGHVIKGWDNGLGGMRVGGKRRLVIEPESAYGTHGSPPKITPNARLTFEVELIAIK